MAAEIKHDANLLLELARRLGVNTKEGTTARELAERLDQPVQDRIIASFDTKKGVRHTFSPPLTENDGYVVEIIEAYQQDE